MKSTFGQLNLTYYSVSLPLVSSSNLTMLQLSILWLVMGVASGDRCAWHQVGRRQSEKRGWLAENGYSGRAPWSPFLNFLKIDIFKFQKILN
jgi:hypothetical protein